MTRSAPYEARSGVRGRCLLTYGATGGLALRFISLLPLGGGWLVQCWWPPPCAVGSRQ
jgi:hypothetical protein